MKLQKSGVELDDKGIGAGKCTKIDDGVAGIDDEGEELDGKGIGAAGKSMMKGRNR